tara:strand:+ start:764 stop:1459 length:696 start_codon:yes stop_codon:yes gene_type:complete
MSHVAVGEGEKTNDIKAMKETVEEECPDLQFVEKSDWRSWVTDHGGLAGDYPLPWIYQLKMLAVVAKKFGVGQLRKMAKSKGVELPQDLIELEKTPLTLEQQNALLQNPDFKKAYDHVVQNHIGQDAKYVIQHKTNKEAYEIAFVPHPVQKDEYVMLADFWQQGKGILNAKGVGQHNPKDGSWGNELKKNYSIRATERSYQRQMKENPNFVGYKKIQLEDGRVAFEMEVRD